MHGKLKQGRESYRLRQWAVAYESLSIADQATPLEAEDLERLARSAYLIGREDHFQTALDRAHHAYLKAGESVHAARCAFWLGLSLLLRGELGPANGWLARAERLLADRDCVEQGYLLLPVAERDLAERNYEAAHTAASRATSIGHRFDEPDLVACALHLEGRVLIQQGRVRAGLALLDEAMVAVTAGELSPVVTGLIYCSVIEACQQAYALRRAREWTSALTNWCQQQPEMFAFTTTCLVRRAEIMQLQGAWPEAIREVQRACNRFSEGAADRPPAAAFYQQAEVYRLRGEIGAAEEAYQNASQGGWEPQPGLALLRMAQGRTVAASAAIRRAVAATTDRLQRTKLLPAYIEIMLKVGELEEARAACVELEETAASFDSDVLTAMAAQGRGAVQLAEGNSQAALQSLRPAWHVWEQVEVPNMAARVRVLTGRACQALGDEDGSGLEFSAARAVFKKLGAAPDLETVDSLLRRVCPPSHGLTARELQVLRLVSAGKTNKAIAAELCLSERTIDRHVSNILTKLNVPSRAAAIAEAYNRKLL